MSTSNVLEQCADFELDDAADVTIVMTRRELESILSIDASHARRHNAHERPTIRMSAVIVELDDSDLVEDPS